MTKNEQVADEDAANCCSYLFFYYMLKRVFKGYKHFRDLENFTEVPKRLNIEKSAEILKKNYEELESQGKPNFLKAIAMTFWRRYFTVLVLKMLQLIVFLCVSLIIMYFSDYF